MKKSKKEKKRTTRTRSVENINTGENIIFEFSTRDANVRLLLFLLGLSLLKGPNNVICVFFL